MSKNLYNFIHPKSSRQQAFSLKSALSQPITHWMLWGTCLLLIVSYIYSIAGSIHNAVQVEKMQTKLSVLRKEMTDMEYSYMSLANKLDLREAYARGFIDSVNPTFVTAESAPSLSLSR